MTEIIQGSEEWHRARLGRVTASRVSDVLARTKTGYSASRAGYMADLIAERLTQTPAAAFTNAAMQWGTDHEPEARSAYEFMRDCEVVEVGFVEHPTIAMSGASPDGLVAADGLVEIKCPNTATHLDTLLTQTIPGKYQTQMLWQMACTGRAWCDFVSYDPRMPAHMSLFVTRLHRDDARIADMEREVSVFLTELDAKLASLSALYEARAAA